ncbi:MAG: hypothetical protein QXS20_08645 [Candidatus Thorarchaeota archaeon]
MKLSDRYFGRTSIKSVLEQMRTTRHNDANNETAMMLPRTHIVASMFFRVSLPVGISMTHIYVG